MKTLKFVPLFLLCLGVASCTTKQSLQEYYVEHLENPNFMAVDLPISLLNIEEVDISVEEREALKSLRKMNILAFKKTDANQAEYELEKAAVRAILDDDTFTELMKMKTSFGRGTVKYLGDEDAIDEVVIYGDSDDKGFLLVRVLGDNMNPANLVQFIQALEKSDYKGDGLEELGAFFKG